MYSEMMTEANFLSCGDQNRLVSTLNTNTRLREHEGEVNGSPLGHQTNSDIFVQNSSFLIRVTG